MRRWRALVVAMTLMSGLLMSGPVAESQEEHVHASEASLGKVTFPISCAAAVQSQFNRGVALLHSFAYAAAAREFRAVGKQDPQCAMAHWGAAMTYFHQLWDPPIAAEGAAAATAEIQEAQQLGTRSKREGKLILAASVLFEGSGSVPYKQRALKYERAMSMIAAEHPKDIETQVFHALALLANVSPADRTHERQKQAAAILEPLFRAYPQHPGIAHYLIHAYDNAEMAPRGVEAAKAYSRIAPAAPHALHMPSHIFTRLGLWDESIASNLAARDAARRAGDEGEELHAMDYLVYAFLQNGEDEKAQEIVGEARQRTESNWKDFKVAYAYVAIPIRYAVERNEWTEAANTGIADGIPLHVEAIAVWARGTGLARTGHASEANEAVMRLLEIARLLEQAGNEYWSIQTRILAKEVDAWRQEAQGNGDEAVKLLREAADREDGIEKLPVTPGPILPAREQLGYLLLEQNKRTEAKKEFEIALRNAPGRRGAVRGMRLAAGVSRER